MRIGIIGLPNVGKSTVFNALTEANAASSNYPFCTIEPNVGIVEVPDKRLEKLSQFAEAKEVKPATVEFVDIAGLIGGASKGEGLGNKFLSHIRSVDVILHVVRCFEDTQISHSFSEIDPAHDVDIVNLELALADLQILDNILQKDKPDDKNIEKLKIIKQQLEQGKFIKDLELNKEEKDAVKGFQFLTSKPIVYLANIKEDDPKSMKLAKRLEMKAQHDNCVSVTLSAKWEEEISHLEEGEKKEYREEFEEEMGLQKLVNVCYDNFGFITFYTIAHEKATAWAIIKGAAIKEAAGKVHSDMEKGFIKAEVISFPELLKYNSYEEAKNKGKLRIEGKEYIVNDGDIIYFKFHQ